MALFKCKMCGGDLEIAESVTIAECEYCGTKQTVPKAIDENLQNFFNRANTLRIRSEFDKASALYEKIIQADPTQSEAYWGLILCKYGIEYVDDPKTLKKIPTCHRASYDSIVSDEDYKSALENADMSQRLLYEEQAKEIDRIQKDILALAQKEEKYDVFICYKETDANGKRTQDSVIANDIYYQLTNEGFKVFYAAITLEGKLGSAYEPIIFAALNSAKVMLAIGTKPEYFNAVWVKNEWSRFLAIIKKDRSKLLIPCYRDMDAYELPEEFAHLQAQDMSKIGFINDVVRGIKKVIVKDEPKATVVKETIVKETVSAGGNANIAPLLKRAFMFLEDSKWSEANEYCEKVLDVDPECADAYLGKLLAQLKVQRKTSLELYRMPFDNMDNYNKIVRFGSNALVSELKQYNITIRERNEENRKAGIYNAALDLAKQKTSKKQAEAAEEFKKIPGYRDSNVRMKECIAKSKEFAEIERKDAIYSEALDEMQEYDIESIAGAIKKFKSIISWKDSETKIVECGNKIKQIKAENERVRVEAEKAAKEKEKAAKAKKKKIILAISSIACIIIAIIVIVNIFNYVKYKPLSDILSSDNINASEIKSNYSDMQNDKRALKAFEKELEKCHKGNNLKKTLDILTALAECDVYFSDWIIGSDGNTSKDLSPYIQGWDTFINWMYAETVKNGQRIATENKGIIVDHGYDVSDDIMETYEIYGYKLSVETYEHNPDKPYLLFLYVPSKGWYKLDHSAKYYDGGSNIGFHIKNGGVMVD